MISSDEYDILLHITSTDTIDEPSHFDILNSLVNDKLISRVHDGMYYPDKYFVTVQGQRAIEEYENTIKTRRLAMKSDRKSTISIIISVVVGLISLGAFVVSIIAIC